jgi:hypothetical protein
MGLKINNATKEIIYIKDVIFFNFKNIRC